MEKKKNKKYFNEKDFVKKLLIYQESCKEENKNEIIEQQLIMDIEKIVGAIIHKHGFYRFEGEDIDDLRQHALENCYKSLVKFIPGKGTAFNYFTKISKMSLLNYTIRREKHRGHSDVMEQIDLEDPQKNNFDFFLENLEENFFKIIDKLNPEEKQKNEKIAVMILDYIRKNRVFESKTDLYSHGKAFGIKNSDVRNFINKFKEHKNILFDNIN